MSAINLAFASKTLESQFHATMREYRNEEIGGILFWQYGQINDLHWKRHKAIFGDFSMGLISDWLICPNVSNLRDREYSVSDIKQLIGIAEQTARSRKLAFIHFHSHPTSGGRDPSIADKNFWKMHFNDYGWARGAIAQIDNTDALYVECHSTNPRNPEQFERGHFFRWSYINYRIKRYYKTHPKLQGVKTP